VDANELLGQADLQGALQSLQDAVKSDPAKLEHRIFLFQLLALMGQWERALTQLNVCGDLSPAALPMVQTYREAMRCEVLRAAVFSGELSPLVFGEPEQWIALMLEALRLSAAGKHAEATAMRAQAFEDAPAVTGTLNGEAFEWIADADSRIGPFLEAVVDGKYYWIPFHRIALLKVDEPEDLRDLVWAPAEFTWSNGGQSVGLIPTRYPGSENADDDRLRMSRLTDWSELAPDCYVGLGQRLLASDSGDCALLEVRELSLQYVEGRDSQDDISADG
jgi:type VI secretion system protein ImpE